MALNDNAKTTLGDRLSTGAVNGAVVGGVVSAGMLAYNGATKLFSKKGAFKFSGTQWKLAGAAAAIGTIIGFFSANREQENRREAYLNNAIEKANDPNNGYSQKQKEQMLSEAFEDTMSGKIDSPESTKFRDMVSARDNSANVAR